MGIPVWTDEDKASPLSVLIQGRHRDRIERNFSKYVSPQLANGCREWVGSYAGRGYGELRIAGRNVAAHRIAYALHHGGIEDALGVLHHCDNPRCVWGPHLFQGDQRANMTDASTKGRFKDRRGEKNPFAKLTVEKVHLIRQLSAEGLGARTIARRVEVSRDCVRKVLKGESWTHV